MCRNTIDTVTRVSVLSSHAERQVDLDRRSRTSRKDQNPGCSRQTQRVEHHRRNVAALLEVGQGAAGRGFIKRKKNGPPRGLEHPGAPKTPDPEGGPKGILIKNSSRTNSGPGETKTFSKHRNNT